MRATVVAGAAPRIRRLHGAGKWVFSDRFDLDFGLGFGLTEASNPVVAKVILGTRIGALWGDDK